MNKILIKNATVLPMTGKEQILKETDILIEKDRITKIGKIALADKTAKKIIAQNMLAMPGLVNAHTHCAMTLFRGLADDMVLKDWLEKKIWPAEAKLTEKDVYWGSMLGILEMLKGGTTCFNDMYWHVEGTAEAVKQSGIRAVLSGVLVGISKTAEADFQKGLKEVQKWQNKAEGRIKMILGPHALYSCPPKYLRKLVKAARKLDVGIHIHLAETKSDQGDIKKAARLGVFDGLTIAAHCVWPTKEEIEILKKYKVAVVHCPVSNLKLASGIAPVWKMIKNGITVALGTDGPASNNTLDMWQTMKFAALVAKAQTRDTTALPAYQALEMATSLGAKALGLGKEIGTLEAGKKADILLVNLKKPHLTPLGNIVSHLVYAASRDDVDTVIIDGKILMKNRKLTCLDEGEVMKEINKNIIRKFKGVL